MGCRITWLGHASVVLDVDGARIVVDPLLGRHNGILRRRGPAPRRDQWQRPDAVLVSHLHHDHAELSSLRLLPAPILTAPANAAFLRKKGLSATGLGDEWYDVPGTPVQVRLTRADHGHRPMPHRPNAANGHLVRTPQHLIWLAGDTAFYDDMAAIPDLAGGPIDLAVVPIGGWGPRLSGGHLGPVTASDACRTVGAAAAMPYHWGTLHFPGAAQAPRGWMDAPGEAFAEALPEHAPGCRSLVLTPGQSVDL